MKIVSTSDVPLADLRHFALALRPDLDAEVDESQVFLRATDPPSWVTLLAEASWWTQLLSAYAALYVAEVVKEAAKDTWRNRSKGLVVAKSAGNRLRKLAEETVELRRQLSAPTTLGIGLPVPNDYFSTRLALEGTSLDELAAQLALFVHHLPALSRLMSEYGLADGTAATGVFLRLRDDGALLVSWHDRQSLQIQERVLELSDEG